MAATPPAYTKKDFQSDQEVRWCPGCGDYAILSAVQSVFPELGIPRCRYSRGDRGFRDVVYDESLVRKLINYRHSSRDVSRENEQVVGQPCRLKQRKAATKLRTEHEIVVRFVVNDMAHPAKLRPPRVTFDLMGDRFGAEIEPSDNAHNALVGFCQAEQPLGLINRLSRLNRNRPVEAD